MGWGWPCTLLDFSFSMAFDQGWSKLEGLLGVKGIQKYMEDKAGTGKQLLGLNTGHLESLVAKSSLHYQQPLKSATRQSGNLHGTTAPKNLAAGAGHLWPSLPGISGAEAGIWVPSTTVA